MIATALAFGVCFLSINFIVIADTHPKKLFGYTSGDHLRCYDPERNKVFSHQPYSMTSCGGNSYRISEKDYQRLLPDQNVYENDKVICYKATDGWSGKWSGTNLKYVKKANKLGLSCGINVNKTINANVPKSEFPLKPITINFPSVSVKRDDVAVIIGNANYKKQGKDIPNVNPAYADAEGIKKYFMKAKGIKEGNIIYLKDATGSQLLGVLGNEKSHKGKLFNYIKPNKSNVYIYYAGHGAPGKEGDAYLVPTDTDSQTIEFTGYPLSTLYSNLGKLPAKSMTVILEACFSGGSQSGSLISRASPIVIQPKKTFIPNNIKVIAAGSERQMASWEEDSSHSLFTKYFLKAMSGEGDSNKDGKVTDAELKDYLSDTMTYYARRYYGRDQKVQIHNGG